MGNRHVNFITYILFGIEWTLYDMASECKKTEKLKCMASLKKKKKLPNNFRAAIKIKIPYSKSWQKKF